jgi:type III secretion protein F
MSETTLTTSFSVGTLITDATKAADKMATGLTKEMATLSAKEDMSPSDLLTVQFKLGQYNTMMETISNVQKSVLDTLKVLAQKV